MAAAAAGTRCDRVRGVEDGAISMSGEQSTIRVKRVALARAARSATMPPVEWPST